MYRSIPEVNRICSQAARDRAYQQHIQALKNMKTCVDTRKPVTPQTIGRNYKKYENEKVRCSTVLRDNSRLESKMRDIQRQEHFPRIVPQRPYTLQGQAQKDEMMRIDRENMKLLKAIETKKPTLNRTEWTKHRLDHTYQITKMSEFKKTIPMSDVVREEYRMSMNRPATSMTGSYSKTHSVSSKGQTSQGSRTPSKHEEEEKHETFTEEEEKQDFSIKKEIGETVKDGLEEKKAAEAGEAPKNDDFSLKKEIGETVKDGLEEKKAAEAGEAPKDEGLSLKKEIGETVKEGIEEKKEAEAQKAEEDEKKKQEEEANKGSLSIGGAIKGKLGQ